MSRIDDTVAYQHAENSCSLWWQWQLALEAPHYVQQDLKSLERRIYANVNGLRIAGRRALSIVQTRADANDDGAIFVLSLLAIQRGDTLGFLELADRYSSTCDGMTELAAALAWADHEVSQPLVSRLLEHARPEQLILGLQACVAHARDPGPALFHGIRHENSRVRATTYRAIANLGSKKLLEILPASSLAGAAEQFELARAFAFLGESQKGHCMLQQLALGQDPIASRAARLLFLSTSDEAGRELLKSLFNFPDRARDLIRGFGLLGDPTAVEWLIHQCHSPEVARLAGESISLITGVDLLSGKLASEKAPENPVSVLNDDPDEEKVLQNEDSHLPWPDVSRLKTWWDNVPEYPVNGTQYLCGHPRSSETCRLVLQNGKQRQRSVAADLLCMSDHGTRYCNTHLPGSRQADFISGSHG